MVERQLQSTVDLVRRAFPGGLDDASYRDVFCVLNPHMAYRSIAAVMSESTGKDEGITYNDAMKADAGGFASQDEIEVARARLAASGLDAWIAED